ncbi:hypothetical protein [Rubripirellula lacrimiformis]|nr:hypothetical protein [Rubripirellula lacrimiformis]
MPSSSPPVQWTRIAGGPNPWFANTPATANGQILGRIYVIDRKLI